MKYFNLFILVNLSVLFNQVLAQDGYGNTVQAKIITERPLEVHELMCLTSHNVLRRAENLTPVTWEENLSTQAAVESAKNMLEEQTDMDLSYFDNNDEILSADETTLKIPPRLTRDHLQIFFSSMVDSLIRNWYMEGLFAKNEEGKERYHHILSTTASKIGCSVRAYALNSTSIRMFLAVAYDSYQPKVDKLKEILEEPVINARLGDNDNLKCQANCTMGQICISHKASVVGARAAGEELFNDSDLTSDNNCICDEGGEYSYSDIEFTRPVCEGPCFIDCPLAEEKSKKQCSGQNFCACSNGFGGALCL